MEIISREIACCMHHSMISRPNKNGGTRQAFARLLSARWYAHQTRLFPLIFDGNPSHFCSTSRGTSSSKRSNLYCTILSVPEVVHKMNNEQNLSDRDLRARRRRAQREGKAPVSSPIKKSRAATSTKRDNDDRSFDSHTSRTKKSRTSSQPVAVVSAPRYKLRSAVARARASAERDASSRSLISSGTATVTPAAPRRQIDFNTRLDHFEKEEKHSDLPSGVIDIFPSKRVNARCICPSQPHRQTTASCCAAKQFVAEYGKENLDYLQEWEEREFPLPPKEDDSSSVTSSVSIDVDDILENIVRYSSASSGGVADAKFLESGSSYLEKQPLVTPRMRAVLVSWLVEVCVEFSISDSAFHVAISILDALFRKGPTKEQYSEMVMNEVDDSDSEDEDDEAIQAKEFFCVKKNELQALGW